MTDHDQWKTTEPATKEMREFERLCEQELTLERWLAKVAKNAIDGANRRIAGEIGDIDVTVSRDTSGGMVLGRMTFEICDVPLQDRDEADAIADVLQSLAIEIRKAGLKPS